MKIHQGTVPFWASLSTGVGAAVTSGGRVLVWVGVMTVTVCALTVDVVRRTRKTTAEVVTKRFMTAKVDLWGTIVCTVERTLQGLPTLVKYYIDKNLVPSK